MQPVLDQSLHTFRRFAERHGYDVVVGGEESIADRAPAWSKVLLLRNLLETYDYVLWVDADAIILDDSVDPVSLLGEEDYQALVRYRWNDEECACTGVWLLRDVEKAKAFLDAVWNSGDGYLRLHPWEQAAAMRLLGYSVDPDRFVAPTEWTKGCLWLANEWDTIPAFTPDRRLVQCRIRHYAARRTEFVGDRCERIVTAWLRLAQRMSRPVPGIVLPFGPVPCDGISATGTGRQRTTWRDEPASSEQCAGSATAAEGHRHAERRTRRGVPHARDTSQERMGQATEPRTDRCPGCLGNFVEVL